MIAMPLNTSMNGVYGWIFFMKRLTSEMASPAIRNGMLIPAA